MNNVRLEGLFPTPVLISKRPKPYTNEEYEFVKNISLQRGTPGQTNKISSDINILDYPEMNDLKKFFIKSVNLFTEQVYLASDNELDITISWINVIEPGCEHLPHKHKNAILSGCYYFEPTHDVPLTVSSPLENHDNYDFSSRKYMNPFNSNEWCLPTDGNTLIMFPAWLQHRVPLNETKKTRYSIAWNAWFKKNRHYGFVDSKTYVET